MKKCLQERILPSQYLGKILSLHIQEQVAMSHTGSRKKAWMILLVSCICQNCSQSSWLIGLNSGTLSRKMYGYPLSGIGTNKVIGLLMGMQAGFTKYCCFFCLWDSLAVSQHYKQKYWGSRSTFVRGEHSLKENPQVDMNKVLLPPLHIKLGLMKNFGKALHKNGASFQHLSTVFPSLSAAKLKEGKFVGPQIQKVLKDNDFEELLN